MQRNPINFPTIQDDEKLPKKRKITRRRRYPPAVPRPMPPPPPARPDGGRALGLKPLFRHNKAPNKHHKKKEGGKVPRISTEASRQRDENSALRSQCWWKRVPVHVGPFMTHPMSKVIVYQRGCPAATARRASSVSRGTAAAAAGRRRATRQQQRPSRTRPAATISEDVGPSSVGGGWVVVGGEWVVGDGWRPVGDHVHHRSVVDGWRVGEWWWVVSEWVGCW